MKTLKGMPMVTVEQCVRYSETASVIEQQRDRLWVELKNLREIAACFWDDDHSAIGLLDDALASSDALLEEIEATK